MRRHAGVMVIATAMGLLVAMNVPVTGSIINPPDLGWRTEGRTFEFSGTDGTNDVEFSVTISDVTTDTITFDYWRVDDGTAELFAQEMNDKDTRENLDWPDWRSHLWVNGEDLDSGTAIIGNTEYTLTETLPDYKFEGPRADFYYDVTHGYLVEVDYHDNENDVDGLINLDDVLPDNAQTPAPPSTNILVECDDFWDNKIEAQDAPWDAEDRSARTVISEIAVCWEVTNDVFQSTAKAAVDVVWPLWETDFTYTYSLLAFHNDQVLEEGPAQFDANFFDILSSAKKVELDQNLDDSACFQVGADVGASASIENDELGNLDEASVSGEFDCTTGL